MLVACFKVLFQHLPEGTEENFRTASLQARNLTHDLYKQNRNANDSAVMFTLKPIERGYDVSCATLCSIVTNVYISPTLNAVNKVTYNVLQYIRGPFETFMDSPYYSESELCGGVVMVSFSKYLPWQGMHFLQHSTHFSKTCCRLFATSFRRIVEQVVLTFHFRFSISKALPPLENCSLSHCIISIGLMDEL
jgi:hypothetical protein